MQNSAIANIFDQIADLLEIQGASSFRVRAYRNAARTVESNSESIESLVQKQVDLQTLPGIGKDLAAKLVEIVTTGQSLQLKELQEQIPPSVVQMLRISGLGPKKVSVLFHELNVRTLDDLKSAAQNGEVARLKGFGEKTQTTILEGLAHLAQTGHRVLLPVAQESVREIADDLRRSGLVEQVEPSGSCRRLKETIGDLDLLAIGPDAAAIMDALAQNPRVEKVLSRGDTKQRVRLKNRLELDLRVVPAESFGAAWQYFTGSKEHNVAIRSRAKELGLKVNEYGVFRDETQIAGSTEEEVYGALGLQWIPPELRENRGEIELALKGDLPPLITIDQIRGDLHMHTTATDGTASIREMAEAAIERGLQYIAITDHSKRVSMARGLDAERLRQHWKEIEVVRKTISGITLFKGIECDILEDGSLDLDDDVLAEADWVLAVLHYGLKQPRQQIQQRLLNAIRNQHVDAIGHPSGRLIAQRAGADIDYGEFLKAAADYGTMLEINANPARLDLDDIHAAKAKEMGIPIVINTDAHSTSGFEVLKYGIGQARRAGLTAHDVANTRSLVEFEKLIFRRKNS